MKTNTSIKVKVQYNAPELKIVKFNVEQGFAASGRISINDFGGGGL